MVKTCIEKYKKNIIFYLTVTVIIGLVFLSSQNIVKEAFGRNSLFGEGVGINPLKDVLQIAGKDVKVELKVESNHQQLLLHDDPNDVKISILPSETSKGNAVVTMIIKNNECEYKEPKTIPPGTPSLIFSNSDYQKCIKDTKDTAETAAAKEKAAETAAAKEKAAETAAAKEKAAATAAAKEKAAAAAKNKPPVVTIPPQLTMNENTKRTIAPTTFNDENPNQVTFLWEQIAGNAKLNLTPNNQRQVTLTAPEILPPNKFGSIKLTANDGKNPPVGSNQLQVTILNVNKPPIINISKIGPVLENKSVVLDATGTSDPDRDQPLRFSWKQITKAPKAVMENNQTSSLTFIAPNVHNDIKLQLQLTVSDGNKINGTAKRTLIIPVTQVNLQPVADAGKNFVTNESSIVTLNGNKTKNPDKLDKLKYLWTQVAGELFIDIKNGKTIKPSFKVPYVKQNNSLYTFKLTVTDPKGLNSSDTVNMTVRKVSNITVNPPNAQVVHNLIVKEGTNATLSAANSTDPDVKEKLTFQWKQIGGQPLVDLRKANNAIAEFIAPVVEENTTLTFNVTATNKKGLNDTATTFIKIANIPEQGFPIIYAIIGGVAAAGSVAAVIIYKFFMRRPSGPARAI